MKTKTIKCKLTFTEEVLGMSPADPEVYRNWIASRTPDPANIEDEVGSVDFEKAYNSSLTVFPRDKDGNPFIWDYQIKGMFKDICQMLSRLTIKEKEDGKKTATKKAVNESGKLTAYKKVIDGLIFVNPRKIPIQFNNPDGIKSMGVCERSLRAQTAQGERIALAASETIPAGSSIEFNVELFDESHEALIREWLEYGQWRGFGQWRNSGKGTFTYEIIEAA